MGKPQRAETGTPRQKGLSKYAQKLAAGNKPGVAASILPSTPKTPQPRAIATTAEVTATVEDMQFGRGYVFLKTPDDTRVYLASKLLKSFCGDKRIKVGYVFRCKVEDQPGHKGLRVTEILSITPA